MSATASYAEFLERKRQLDTADGFEPVWMPDFLFGFQSALVDWAIRQGRAAIFADCGMGKGPMALVWAENVIRHTNGRVLILTPLAVGQQFVAEGEKFDIEVQRSRDGCAHEGITVTNYEQIDKFDPADFAGVVCDESSAIKAFDGRRRALVTEFMRRLHYRLLCTATAAPNDYVELGTSSEALGYLGHMDMLGRFFVNDQNTSHAVRMWKGSEWRFKGHAEEPFWRWVSSWARALRRPSDLGFSDEGFDLPPLEYRQHTVTASLPRDGALFDMPAVGIREEREEQRRTVTERCERAAAAIADAESAICWCHLNAESELLTRLIPDAVQVRGSDDPDVKEEALTAFGRGQVSCLVTKPSLGAWGLNWQHCNRMTYFPSYSYEQHYQAVRRCWRYGQTRPVTVDVVSTTGGAKALKALIRKGEQADRMFDALTVHMRDALNIDRAIEYPDPVEVPEWL